MSAPEPAEALVRLLSTTDSPPKDDMGKKFQRKRLRIFSPMSSPRLYCCYAVIIVLTGAVIALSVALSLAERRPEPVSIKNANGACPRSWIGFGSKCFYFSEDTSNWTFSQNFCMEREAQLARFDNMEELNFLKRYIGTFDYWIGLHRESPKHTWRWMDNTEYNSSVPIQGVENYAYLNSKKISSARIYSDRRWICSKHICCILQCQIPCASS